MSAYDDFKALRSAKYDAITSFIANPEPVNDLPNVIARLVAIEDWILAKELE